MLLSIEAEEKSGKTAFAYTAPLPIVGFSLDMGTKRSLYGSAHDKWFKGLKILITDNYSEPHKGWDIIVYEKPPPLQLTDRIKDAADFWTMFQEKYVEIGLDPSVSSLVFDTATLVRKAAIDAHMEFVQKSNPNRKQLLQIEYSHPNDEIRRLWNFGQHWGKNLIGTHHLTDEYKNVTSNDGKAESVPTGNKVLEGYNRTLQAVDIGVRMHKVKGAIKTTIVTCGYDPELEGKVLDNCDWNMLVGLVELSTGGRIELDKR